MANIKQDLEILIELQKKDIAQDKLRIDVDKKKAKVEADNDALRETEDRLDALCEDINAKNRSLTGKENELAEALKGLAHAEDKMEKVGNSRDFATIEQEKTNFEKIKATIEGEIEKLKEDLQIANDNKAKAQEEFDNLKAVLEASVADHQAAEAAIEEQVNALAAEAAELAKKISPEVLKRYQFIRKRRSGEALVSASNGTCVGCHMKLQPQNYIRLQRQQTLECCQNCQRILYFSAEEHISNADK